MDLEGRWMDWEENRWKDRKGFMYECMDWEKEKWMMDGRLGGEWMA